MERKRDLQCNANEERKEWIGWRLCRPDTNGDSQFAPLCFAQNPNAVVHFMLGTRDQLILSI
ncbi:hypothetical protein Peur_045099 [Populus x canadensis]|jgi:hypothetical protein